MTTRRQFIRGAAGVFVPAIPALILPKEALAQVGGLSFPGPGPRVSSGGGSNHIVFNAAGSLGGGGSSTGSSTTITTTVANCIIVLFNLSNSNAPSGVTDTAGLTWTPFATQALKTGLWWALKPTAGATTITTALGGTQFNVVHSVAFSGVNTTSPADPSGSLPAYTSTSTPVTISPSNANDVLLAGYVTGGSATAGSGWTMVSGSGANFDLFEYQIVTSASPVSATITGTISSGIGSALVST